MQIILEFISVENKMPLKVAIIGGGIIGMSCAVKIAQYFNEINESNRNCNSAIVTLISDKLSPNTTGDGSAGLWGPYLIGETPYEKVM